MNGIKARLAAVVAGFVLATLARWGVGEATPDLTIQIESWVNHTFDVLLLLGYAVVHPWLQRRGARTEAAQ